MEIGDLLESEELKTEEGLIALAEEFAGSGQEPICLDELLSLSLQELKEKIVSLPLQMELGTAPLKEEIFDALLASCLKRKPRFETPGSYKSWRMDMVFSAAKDDYRLKSQCRFVPELLVKKYGLKTGQLVQGFLRAKMAEATCPVLLQVEQVMGRTRRSKPGYSLH